MSYIDFLTQLKQNTRNKLDEYKELCRFCLEYQLCGIEIGDNNCSLKQPRDSILNNYTIITKEYLPTSEEYPKFVCLGCDVKDCDELNQMPVKEIKFEYCDESYDNVQDTDTNIFRDALELPLLKLETNSDICREANNMIKQKKRKIGYSEPRPMFVSLSTEYERTCQLCDEPTFPSLTRFYKHQLQHHPEEKSFICDICGSRFNHKTRLATHMKDRHTKWGKTHQCQFCASLFYSSREVKGHEKSHANARSYVCNLCGKAFNHKTTLNVHLKTKVHNANYKTIIHKKKRPYVYKFNMNAKQAKKVLRCQLCVPSSVFSTPEERTAHRNAMHRKFECEICKNSFMAQESLDSHKAFRHSDKPRPFVCTVCDATFNQSSHLASHFKRKHTGEKTVHCPHCDRSFFESFELKTHVKLVHEKHERVKCNKCDLDFVTEKYLQKQILLKHTAAASPYDCKICGKRSENGAKLEQHRLKHHK